MLLVNENNVEYDEAMNTFYSSKLIDTKTGLYLESTPYIYGLLKDELKNGALLQNEI